MSGYKVTGGSVKQQGAHKLHAEIPEFKGRHLWCFFGVWQVANPAASAQNFDVENLLTVEGPGCWWCEQQWKPTIGSKCPGEPGDHEAGSGG